MKKRQEIYNIQHTLGQSLLLPLDDGLLNPLRVAFKYFGDDDVHNNIKQSTVHLKFVSVVYLLPYLNEASQQCVCVNNSCVDSAFRSTINGPMKELMHIQCTSFCPCIINMRNFDKIIKG